MQYLKYGTGTWNIEHFETEPTYDNMRAIYNVMSATKTSDPMSIQAEIWKIMVEVYGRDGEKKFTDRRKEILDVTRTSNERPNHSIPPVTRDKRQYDKDAHVKKVSIDDDSSDSDDLNFLEATMNDFYLNIVKIEPIEIETVEEKSVMNAATIQWCIAS